MIAETIGATLKDAGLVVEACDEAERDLVLGLAEGGDALDHGGEALVGFEELPSEALRSCPRCAVPTARTDSCRAGPSSP